MDRVTKFLAHEGRVSLICASTTDLVEEIRNIHDLTPTTTAALGRFATIAGMMGLTELKNEDYTKEEILIGINYMVSINERCFNFLPNKIEEALSKNTSIDDMAKQYDSYEELITDILNGKIYYGTIILEENILKKSVVLNLKSDLINGLVDLKRLSTSYKKIGVLLAKEILNNNLYNKKFTKQQWIDIINL